MPSHEWETPQGFFDTLDAEFGFTLDVCATEQNAKCRRFFSQHHDSLDRDWTGETVWMNPPYNKSIRLWVRKAYRESQKGATVVCLIQPRGSDTAWWHEFVMRATEWRFVRDRLHFRRDDGFSGRSNVTSLVVIFRPGHVGPLKISAIDINGRRLAQGDDDE